MKSAARTIRFFLGLTLLGVGVGIGVNHYGAVEVRRLSAQVQAMEKEKEQLQAFARRLCAARRVAQVDVVDQRSDADGAVTTMLRWQEIEAGGRISPPRQARVEGRLVYFEAMVIKFDFSTVGNAEPGRDESLVAFRRVFGERQSPESGYDARPVQSPEALGATPREQSLWRRFWMLVDDPALAAQHGVRVAQIEAPAVPLTKGETWEVTLDAAGGLNLRKLHAAPPPYRPSSSASDPF